MTKTLGEIFREKREEKGFSLKEIENDTSIRMSYLEAIETGKMSEAISPVYLQGFMRQYASHLGIPLEQLSQQFPEAFVAGEGKHDFAYGIGTLEVRGSTHGGVRWLPNLLWAGVVGLVLIGAWYFAKAVGVF